MIENGPFVKHPLCLNLMKKHNLKAKRVGRTDEHTFVLAEKLDNSSV